MRKSYLFFIVFFILFNAGSSAFAKDNTVYGPKIFKAKTKAFLGKRYYHYSMDRVKLNQSSNNAKLIITKLSNKKLKQGYIIINNHFYSLKNFFKSKQTSKKIIIKLRKQNYLGLYFIGEKNASIIIKINDYAITPKPKITFTAKPDSIEYGEIAQLSWKVVNADTCKIEPGVGSVDLKGSITVSPVETTTFTITASGPGGKAAANVTVTLLNSVPKADDQSVTTSEDTAVSFIITGSDPDNDPLVYQIVTGPSSGTLSGSIPNLTYTPDSNYHGSDTITFKTSDGQADSNTATITLTINAVNDVPVANAGTDQKISRTDTVTLDGSGSSDIDGDALAHQWSFVSMPSGSTTTLSNPSSVSPVFVADVTGVYELKLIVGDGSVESTPDTITITASPKMVTVPAVINQPQADATTVITAAGLSIGTITTVNSDTVPANTVISQTPDGGTQIVENSSVDLVVSLGPAIQIPTVSIYADSQSVQIGEPVTLSWNTTNATTAFIEPGTGSVAVNGSVSVTPKHTTTYTISVTGTDGSASDQVTIKVTGDPAQLPEGSFGNKYNDLIPVDSIKESYDEKRISLVTGIVHDKYNTPISGVNVTIKNQPEYGTAVTDGNGSFTIPVEGGGILTLSYQKDGLIPVHRQVHVPWNDIAVAKSIIMISQDPVATRLTFDGNSDTVITHQSTPVVDKSGIRSCTMVFQGDNQAYLVDKDGKDVHELTTIVTRASEFTTPESMPAVLPPNSAYTYCAELSVDGASRVRFAKPVITWVNNFLGFEVGEIVPVGYYDRDEGVWKPADNGLVVELLDTDNDGLVDALDANGDGNPDDLNNDGSFSDEVTGLDDGAIYVPGATFWRVAVSHFTPWDYNWPYGPPLGAIDPNPKASPDIDLQAKESMDCKNYNSSFVEERSRIFHEDIPVPGTDLTLHYTSNRVKGYKTLISVPASGDTVPDSLKNIIVRVTVAGRTFEQTLAPLPDQTIEFAWDGLDSLGRVVDYPTKAHISIGFEYDLVYHSSSSSFTQAFGQVGDEPTLILGRQDITIWKQKDIVLSPGYQVLAKGGGLLAQGWNLSTHHFGSKIGPTIFKGDGTTGENYIGGIISTQFYSTNPNYISMDSTGNFYISSTPFHVIDKMDINGTGSRVAGNPGSAACVGDGVPALDAMLLYPHGICLDSAGNLYIAGCNSIRKVDTDGIITTVVGNMTAGYSGDGGPAIDATLNGPTDLVIDAAGNLYIADNWNFCIRKVDTNGIITTVAGGGDWQNGIGDGGPATKAYVQNPDAISMDLNGNLYIVEWQRIRKVDTSGIITTVAGNGMPGYSGDGGPATQASFDSPEDIYVDSTGNLYIADTGNHRIRKVDTNGIITTEAGNGKDGFSGDNGPARKANLFYPTGIFLDPTGDLYIADTNNHRIRKVEYQTIYGAALGTMNFTEENGLGHIMSSFGRHLETVDLDTGVALRKFGYDENNNLISITDRFGRQITIERDATNGVPTAIISPDGIRTALVVDVDNYLKQITNADGSFYKFEYTDDGLMTAKIEPGGNRFEHIFDSKGRLTDSFDEEAGHWKYTRTIQENGDVHTEVLTGEGNLTTYLDHTYFTGAYESTITSPTGGQTFFTKSADGLTTTKSLPCGMELAFEYDLDTEYQFKYIKQMSQSTQTGLTKTIEYNKIYEDTDYDGTKDRSTRTIDLNGKILTISNNVLLSQEITMSPEGRSLTVDYDPDTLVTTSTHVPGLEQTNYSNFTNGKLNTITTGTRQTSFTYDANGFLSSITDPLNITTTLTNDVMGRVTYIAGPDGSGIKYNYDENGNMTVLITQLSINHLFGYDRINKNDQYTTPLSGSYSYVYDKDRRLVQKNFPSGNAIAWNYENPSDPGDKSLLWQIQTPEGNIDYTYSCPGKIDAITKGSESITYGYDASLVTSLTLAGTLNQTLEFIYNNDFALSSFTYAGTTENYTYDLDGLLTGTADFTISRYNEKDVNETGLPYQVSDASITLNRMFNTYGETNTESVSISGNDIYSWNITERFNDGRIKTRTETIAGTSITYNYTYDSMNRLKTVQKDGIIVEDYTYDSGGARTQADNTQRNITGRTSSYDDDSHLLTSGTTSYQYDLDGFLTSRTTTTTGTTNYTYSSSGELLNVTLEDGTLIEYLHDPLGRRIAKKVNGSITQKYLWQGLTTLLAVYDGSDNLLMRFKYADSRMPIAMEKQDSTFYLSYDQVGSLRAVADSSGKVVKQISYDTFGYILNDTDPPFEIPFGFAGGLHDRDTGLVRFGYRDYDPDTGRWTAKDPILFAGGDTDLYGYVLNDPVNFIDPWGLIWVTTGHDYHGIKNWGRGFLNWLTRKIGSGWDPGIPGSNPSDYEGATRDVEQEWQHDKDNPCIDSEHTIGEKRKIKQEFKKKPTPKPDELWDPNTTHYWAPPVSTRTYDDY